MPKDTMTDRVRKDIAAIQELADHASDELGRLSGRLWGENEVKGAGGAQPPGPGTIEGALFKALADLHATAERVRRQAAELNGRI